LLRRVVDDSAIPVEHRLAAAEALTECGPDGHRASEEGLRAILTSPDATAEQLRNTAVVLATFDGESRAHAVTALTAVLDDRDAPDHARVHAATGLVEIDVEHHERAADVFREVLRTRTDFAAGLRDAAVGLASLGPQRSDEAVAALTRLITDRRLPYGDRVSAAQALAELGPQHRETAVDHLVSLAGAFGVSVHTRSRIARSLADNGAQGKALELLRTTLGDWTANGNDRLWVARALTDLGPEHRDEVAAVLRDVTTRTTTTRYNVLTALADLAALGEPHRAPAVESLRATLADRADEPSERISAGTHLIELGPEFHDEVAGHLSEIAERHPDPDARMAAWRALRRLGTGFRERASAAVLALAAPEQAEHWAAYHDYPAFNQFDVDDREAFAEVLTAVLRDPAWDGRARVSAAAVLISLGHRFHRRVVDEVIRLLGARTVPDRRLPALFDDFGRLDAGLRARAAAALRALATDPDATAATVCQVAEAMEKLDHWSDPAVVARLRDIVDDDLLPLSERGEAAVALARATPDALDTAVALVMSDHTDGGGFRRRVRALAALGADLGPHLRARLVDEGADRRSRLAAAEVLAELRPDLRDEALAEIRGQAADRHLEFQWRTDAVMLLAEHDPTTVAAATDFHARVLHDESHPVRDRCEAAYRLLALDPAHAETAASALHRFATSPEFSVGQRAIAVEWLPARALARWGDTARLALAVIRDPAARPVQRLSMIGNLWDEDRVDAERDLLLDRAASPKQRAGDLDEWHHPALGSEAVAALRDTIAAPETMPAERIDAAVALVGLAPRLRPEAVRVVEQAAHDPSFAYNVREALLVLSGPERQEPLVEDCAVAQDDTLPRPDRGAAVHRLHDLTGGIPERLAPVVRDLVDGDRLSDRLRVSLLYALRASDGLRRLRDVRDDARTSPAVRWEAARQLHSHLADDRAAGLRVLHGIAADPACRPPLRWQAARDLLKLGEPGREAGSSCLWSIATDHALPLVPRVDAAVVLGSARPDLRTEVVALLRRMRDAENPRVRIQVLDAIGQFETAEGALALRDMARDRTLDPAVRLRAATSAAILRRDHREASAVVAREVAHDPAVPRHVRVKAARALARWSELCRPEARALLVELSAAPPG
ncbi:MAG: HEAT repeat domain-containing protein, partial [Saccharothrix sp.]|nr:HEAT repeat domain-containing protein [Saccharothrix sp.]